MQYVRAGMALIKPAPRQKPRPPDWTIERTSVRGSLWPQARYGGNLAEAMEKDLWRHYASLESSYRDLTQSFVVTAMLQTVANCSRQQGHGRSSALDGGSCGLLRSSRSLTGD
jgi:hypothetical protein